MIFWKIAAKSMMIDFQIQITHQVIQAKISNWYIKRDGNGMIYTIGGNQDVEKMQQNLMGWTKNSSVSWLASQHLYSFFWKRFSLKSLCWRLTKELKALILSLASSYSSLGSGCWWHQTLAQIGRSILSKTLYIFSMGAQFVSTSLCLAIVLKVSALISISLTPPHSKADHSYIARPEEKSWSREFIHPHRHRFI